VDSHHGSRTLNRQINNAGGGESFRPQFSLALTKPGWRQIYETRQHSDHFRDSANLRIKLIEADGDESFRPHSPRNPNEQSMKTIIENSYDKEIKARPPPIPGGGSVLGKLR
jgi:hypothetical protein